MMMQMVRRYGSMPLCLPLIFLFLSSGVTTFPQKSVFPSQMERLSCGNNPDRYTRGLLNVPEQFHFLRGNVSSRHPFRLHGFSGAAPETAVIFPLLFLWLSGASGFFRAADRLSILHIFTKHCPVRAGPAF